MIFVAHADGRFTAAGQTYRCALGKTGVIAAVDKREGDGKSPLGVWPLLSVFYRADRLPAPVTHLPAQALTPADGWCDAPEDPLYNRFVHHPYPASAEHLWRDDHVYDLIAVLGHNTDPVVPHHGSAIFLHIAKPDYAGTEGCIALAQADLLAVLALATPESVLKII